MPNGQIAFGQYLGGGEAIRRGLGGIGTALRDYGMLQLGMAQNAEQRAFEQYQAEESRRRWEAEMEADRKREERLAGSAEHAQQASDRAALLSGMDAVLGAKTPEARSAVISTLGPVMPGYVPGYRKAVDSFEIQPPDLPGIEDRIAIQAPGTPDEPEINPLEHMAKLPFEEEVERLRGAAGREFPDTPEGRAAAIAWRDRYYGGGGGAASGFEPTASDVRNVLDSLIPEGTLGRSDEDRELYARLYAAARSDPDVFAALPDSVAAARRRGEEGGSADVAPVATEPEGPGALSRIGRGMVEDFRTIEGGVRRLLDGDEESAPGRRLRGPGVVDEVAEAPEPAIDKGTLDEARTLARRALDNGFDGDEVVAVLVEDLGLDEETARALVEGG